MSDIGAKIQGASERFGVPTGELVEEVKSTRLARRNKRIRFNEEEWPL